MRVWSVNVDIAFVDVIADVVCKLSTVKLAVIMLFTIG